MYCRIIPSQHGNNYGIAWHSTSFSHRFRGRTGIADAIENGLNFGAQTQPLALVAVMKCNAAVPIILLLLLAGSGCAALIYEIVWFQLLQLVIGSSAVSLGLLLAAYMGGWRLPAGWKRHRSRLPGWEHSTVRMSPVRLLAVSSRGSTSCAFTTWRLPRTLRLR